MPENTNKVVITVIVNGESVDVEASANAPLRALLNKALEESGNVGQPPENWEMKDGNGNVLALDQKIEEFNFPVGVVLTLNLKAGVGG